MTDGGGQFGDLSEEEVAEYDDLTLAALDTLLVGCDDYVRGLAPAQRADLLDMIGMVNMRAMSDQKKAVVSTSSTLLSSAQEPSTPPSKPGSKHSRQRSPSTH